MKTKSNRTYLRILASVLCIIMVMGTSLAFGADTVTAVTNDHQVSVTSVQSISSAKITGIKSKTYTGSLIRQDITVTLGSKKLTKDRDYVVLYGNNLSVGTAKITIKGKGNYTGSISKTFKILPIGTTFASTSKGKHYINVSVNKVTKRMSKYRITGYQIQLATNSSFTKNKKLFTLKGYTNTSKKITDLWSGTSYYIRVRTYKKVNSIPYYSNWSLYRKVTTQSAKAASTKVYWTPNGEVYHYSKYCSTLSRSRVIYEGTIAESGKSRGCKVCG